MRIRALLMMVSMLTFVAACRSAPAQRHALAQTDVPQLWAPVDAVLDIDLGQVDEEPTGWMAIEGDLIFWLVSGRLGIYDRAAGADGVALSVLQLGRGIQALERVGELLAIAPSDRTGILLFDISDPARPEALPPLRSYGSITYMASEGAILYAVAARGLSVPWFGPAPIERFDLSDGANPVHESMLLPEAHGILGLAAGDGWLALGYSPRPTERPERGQVTLFRPRAGEGPGVLHHLPLDLECTEGFLSGPCRPDFAQLTIEAGRLLVHDHGGVNVYDLDAAGPTRHRIAARLGSQTTAPPYSELFQGRLHVYLRFPESAGGPGTRVGIYDLETSGTANWLGGVDYVDLRPSAKERFALGSGMACRYTADYPPPSPQCYDLSEPSAPRAMMPLQLGWPAVIDGAVARDAEHDERWISMPGRIGHRPDVHFYDLRSGSVPTVLFRLPHLQKWVATPSHLFGSADDARIQIYRIEDEQRLTLLNYFCPGVDGCLPGGNWEEERFEQLLLDGDRLYAIDSDRKLLGIDISQPELLQERARLELPGDFDHVERLASGDHLLLTGGGASDPLLIDITDPDDPTVAVELDLETYGRDLQSTGSLVVGSHANRLSFHDVSNPDAPVTVGSFPYQHVWRLVPRLFGHSAYLALGDRIEVIDIEDPAQAQTTAILDEPGIVDIDILSDGRLVLLPQDEDGSSYARILGPLLPLPVRPLPTSWIGNPATATPTHTPLTPLPTSTETPTPVPPSETPTHTPLPTVPTATWTPTPVLTPSGPTGSATATVDPSVVTSTRPIVSATPNPKSTRLATPEHPPSVTVPGTPTSGPSPTGGPAGLVLYLPLLLHSR